jgi:hypothetical protein
MDNRDQNTYQTQPGGPDGEAEFVATRLDDIVSA